MLETLLSSEDVAGYLGVPVTTLYAWRQKGYGPKGIRVGRHTRYREADVAAWVEEQGQCADATA